MVSKRIESITTDLVGFVDHAQATLAEISVDTDRLSRMQSKIPSELRESFDKNPAAVARLLSAWTYVNQAPFGEDPNLKAFLHGDRANWALAGRRIPFERDIEEDAYDDLLDYCTSGTSKPRSMVILGSAGYGTSTLLSVLASRLVTDRAARL